MLDLKSPTKKLNLKPAQVQKLKRKNFELIGYHPWDAQMPVHESGAAVRIISGGEGSGKSMTTAMEIAGLVPSWSSVLFVAYKHESAHNEAGYLYSVLNGLGLVKSYSAPKGQAVELVLRTGGRAESVSTDKEGARAVSGTGKTYDILCMIEAGKQSYAVFLSCLLRISRSGGLLMISGTIEESEPWFPDFLRRLENKSEAAALNAQVIIIPSWENRTFYPGGINDPKIVALRKQLTPELFQERLAGAPSKSAALVLPEFGFATHVFDWVEFDPVAPTELWIDPGYSGSHYSVLFVQFHPRAYTRRFRPELPDISVTDVWVYDELYLTHHVHEEVIMQAVQKNGWRTTRSAVGDVVMKTHPMAGQSPEDVWREKTKDLIAGGLIVQGEEIKIKPGVDRHRTFLRDPGSGSPRIFFNERCRGATGEYGKWKRKIVGENAYGEPLKDNCDALKAINYGLVHNYGLIEIEPSDNQILTYDKAQTDLFLALERD